MPLYEYRCGDCERRFEQYVKAFGEAVTCPSCAGRNVEKLLSSFAMAGSSGRGAPTQGGCCRGGCGCRH